MHPTEQDRAYLERRQRESADRAAAATDPGIGWVHREFAARYSERLATLSLTL